MNGDMSVEAFHTYSLASREVPWCKWKWVSLVDCYEEGFYSFATNTWVREVRKPFILRRLQEALYLPK